MTRAARAPLLLAAAAVALPSALVPVVSGAGGPRGVNTWDSLPNIASEADVLRFAAYMRDVLLPFGYDTLTVDGGWYGNADGSMSLDAYGRPYPSRALFPSSADGRGLKSLAEKVNAMGVKLGAWTIRGLPRAAVEANLPIWGSAFRARDAASLERNCSWDAQIFGTNAPSAAASAWYESVAQVYLDYGLEWVKIDCMWPGAPGAQRFDEDVAAFATAFSSRAPAMPISWSPGDGMLPANGSWIASHKGAFGVMYRVTPDFHDNSWARLKAHLAVAVVYAPLIGLGGTYPDLDMLPLGNQSRGGSSTSPCLFSRDEQRLIMSLWTITRAPLLIGAVLPLDPGDTWTLSLLTNPAVLAVQNGTHDNLPAALALPPGQDPTTLYAWQAAYDSSATYVAVALFNAQDSSATVGTAVSGGGCATNLWTGASEGALAAGGVLSRTLPPHGSGLWAVTPTCEEAARVPGVVEARERMRALGVGA